MEIEFSVGDARRRAFLALPERAAGPRPGVLVLHEIYGLNDDIRRIAQRFAAAGYVALAPDLYSAGPRAICVARAVISMQLGGGPALRDLEAARSYLAARDDVRADRLGVAGFCMGGGFALLLARTGDIKIAAPFYGTVPRRAPALEGICPVVGGYGAEDRVFGPQGRRLKRHLQSLGVRHDVKLYDGVGHSYMNQHEPSRVDAIAEHGPMRVGYNAEAAEDSWKRMLAWFGEYLGAD